MKESIVKVATWGIGWALILFLGFSLHSARAQQARMVSGNSAQTTYPLLASSVQPKAVWLFPTRDEYPGQIQQMKLRLAVVSSQCFDAITGPDGQPRRDWKQQKNATGACAEAKFLELRVERAEREFAARMCK